MAKTVSGLPDGLHVQTLHMPNTLWIGENRPEGQSVHISWNVDIFVQVVQEMVSVNVFFLLLFLFILIYCHLRSGLPVQILILSCELQRHKSSTLFFAYINMWLSLTCIVFLAVPQFELESSRERV